MSTDTSTLTGEGRHAAERRHHIVGEDIVRGCIVAIECVGNLEESIICVEIFGDSVEQHLCSELDKVVGNLKNCIVDVRSSL